MHIVTNNTASRRLKSRQILVDTNITVITTTTALNNPSSLRLHTETVSLRISVVPASLYASQ